MVVDEEALELLDLLVVEHDLGELADAGVGAVHDLARRDLVFEHRAADLDALEGGRVELDLLAVAGDAHELLDGQRPAVQDDRHGVSFSRGFGDAPGGPRAARGAGDVLAVDTRRGPAMPGRLAGVPHYGRKWRGRRIRRR